MLNVNKGSSRIFKYLILMLVIRKESALFKILKTIQATTLWVHKSHIFESPSISSLIPSHFTCNWNPVRDFAVGAKSGYEWVERFKNGLKTVKALVKT